MCICEGKCAFISIYSQQTQDQTEPTLALFSFRIKIELLVSSPFSPVMSSLSSTPPLFPAWLPRHLAVPSRG